MSGGPDCGGGEAVQAWAALATAVAGVLAYLSGSRSRVRRRKITETPRTPKEGAEHG